MFHIRRYFSTGLIVLLSLVAAMAIYVLVTGRNWLGRNQGPARHSSALP